MSVIKLTQELRDAKLKKDYMQKMQELIKNNPGILVRMEQTLTPEKIALCREDMEAIVRGELPGARAH